MSEMVGWPTDLANSAILVNTIFHKKNISLLNANGKWKIRFGSVKVKFFKC